ncbi:type II toxin-antitoxin system VapC family toxin [Rhizobium sp. SG2393]|uniref:type II toxin-antitoxin system VapC family toxin n=1 Tax=Rhizobium sp. SG2393 TaxID=3276279 RepID=UPI00366AFF8B
MKLLVDTHVAIWIVSEPNKLPLSIRTLLTNPENRTYVSAVSVWEIAIKRSRRGAKAMPLDSASALTLFRQSNLHLLDITPEHAAAVEQISTAHADPFDRLLIAQAITEPLALITRDSKIAAYSPTFITW